MTDVQRTVPKKFFFLPHARPSVSVPPTPTSPPSPMSTPIIPITPKTTASPSFPSSFPSGILHSALEKPLRLSPNSPSAAHPRREVCLPPTPQHDPSYALASSAMSVNECNNNNNNNNNGVTTTTTTTTSSSNTHQSLLTARNMDQFEVLDELGKGSFGSVFKARHKVTGEMVAIKKMKKKFTSQGECRSLQEVKALEALRSGPNIVRLHHFFLEKKELHMVFELMEGNLYQLIKDQNGLKLEESQVKSMVFQVLRGLQHMHAKGIMHRDMKPENLLVTGDVVKIADLGLARDLKSRPPYTTYVSTRWYRSPEVVFKSSAYSCAVDVWAAGTIAAELISLKPLFPGNSDMDQVSRISNVLGSPAPRPQPTDTEAEALSNVTSGIGGEWKEGVQMAARMGFTFPTMPVRTLRSIIPDASEEAVELITGLLQYDPKSRLTAYQALHSNWFKDMPETEDLKFLTDIVQQSPDKRRSMFSGFTFKKDGKDKEKEKEKEKEKDKDKEKEKEREKEKDREKDKEKVKDKEKEKEKVKDRKRGLSLSLPSNTEKSSTLATMIMRSSESSYRYGFVASQSQLRLQGQEQEQEQEQQDQQQLQQQSTLHLNSGFDLPLISPISPFWNDT